jgi:coenzyme F420-0:L-glutamate ligase/coenzyme F420-1:gamma-L-glutamate ligase
MAQRNRVSGLRAQNTRHNPWISQYVTHNMPLTLTPLSNIPLIRRGDNLADVLVNALQDTNIALQDNDILVLAQKIVSKAEGRMVNLATVVELMLQESNEVLRARVGTIIVEHKLGFVCANAGIDHSNVSPLPEEEGLGVKAGEYVLLLPENTDKSASEIRARIESATNKKIGVLIIDSHGRAWRNGTVGIAIGVSGIPGLVDLRGDKDLFGYTLRVTQVGAADELAAAASLMMGQAAEGTPAIHVRGFPYKLRESALKELIRPKDEDLFR